MRKLLAVSLLACIVLFACKKGNENFVSTTTLLNAAIGLPAVSLNLNGNPVIANVPYDSIRYNVRNPSGTYALTFTATGIINNLYSVNTGFSSGSGYTSIVYDSANPKDTINNGPHLYFQKDVIPTIVTDGKCSVRFFDLIPDTVSTGHIFVKVDTGTSVISGKFYFSQRSCGDFGSSNAFAEMDTTSLLLQVVKDTSAALTKTVATYNLGLKNGKIYSIFLTGVFGATGTYLPKLIVQQHN